MPSRDPADSDDSEAEVALKKDEYGEDFEDFGFLERAEEHKERGNVEFQKERYEKALKEYDGALDQLLTVSYDKSIIVGKMKWVDVVIFRSKIHLNKSACHYKLRNWRKAIDEATECIVGNVRDEMMFSDAHIKKKVKDAEKKHGACGVTFIEQRLPRPLRAKAWFRLSRCFLNLENAEKAREACAKALEMADDDKDLLAELAKHSAMIASLEKNQKQQQKKRFAGFFSRLQDRGGYVDTKAQKKATWDSLSYEEKLRHVEELDDSDGEDSMLPTQVQIAGFEESGMGLDQDHQEPRAVLSQEEELDLFEQYRAADIVGDRQEDLEKRERMWRDSYWHSEASAGDQALRASSDRLAQRKFTDEFADRASKLEALEDSSDDEQAKKRPGAN